VYDTTADTWTGAAPMPTPRDHLASASRDGLVHVIGGRSATLGLTGSTHEVYDPASNTWSTAAELPTGRSVRRVPERPVHIERLGSAIQDMALDLENVSVKASQAVWRWAAR